MRIKKAPSVHYVVQVKRGDVMKTISLHETTDEEVKMYMKK